jgi:hypothetical protein
MSGSKILTDPTGSYDLSTVVAVNPMVFKDKNQQVVKTLALLQFTSGRRAATQTPFVAARQQWLAVVDPTPAPAAAPAAGSASPAPTSSAAA